MKLNRILLAFTGRDRYLERLFLQHHTRHHLKFWRMCMLLGIVAYGSAGFLDAWIFPELRNTLWKIRYAYVIPFFFVALAISLTSWYRRIWQYVNLVLILATGSGAVAMAVLAPAPYNHIVYFDSLIVVLFFGFSLIRSRFVVATAAAWALFIGYGCVLIFDVGASAVIRANNLFILSIIVLVGMLVAYFLELADRSNFYLSHHLQKAKEVLEQRVKERTRELSQANIALSEQIEERKREEARRLKLEKQFRQSQKLDAIGTLSAGIAHDFNNILGIMIGYCELIKDTLPVNDRQINEYIDEIMTAGFRATEIVRQILTFSRQDEQALKPIRISSLAKEAIKLMRASLPAAITIRTNYTTQAYVMADPTQINQIIMNLCTNAKHAMKDQPGEISVSLTEVDIDEDFLTVHPGLTRGRYIRLVVSDTGCGMSSSVKERIFEPFFTTRELGQGTGLGLSVVHGIVENHGGAISVYSEPGIGSTFSIFLPVTDQQATCASPDSVQYPHGRERILYVDDEKELVLIAQGKLEYLGYTVTGVTDSREAWRLFEADPDRFDMVISDLNMPHTSGLQLAKKALDLRPGFPFILCTGYGQKKNEEEGKGLGIRGFLSKPILTAELSRTIRAVFDAKGCEWETDHPQAGGLIT
jgi:signal transduction histidine kinase/ActR/RegA family two-component response regulator